MNTEEHICRTAISIERRRAEGKQVSKEDISFLKRHLNRCSKCRADSAIVSAFSTADFDEKVDDLAKRRLFDDVLTQAANDHDDQKKKSIAKKDQSSYAIIAAAAAAAAAALVALGLNLGLTGESKSQIEKDPAVAAKITPEAKTPLTKKETQKASRTQEQNKHQHDKTPMSASINKSAISRKIDTRNLRRKVMLPSDIDLLVEPNATVFVAHMNSTTIEVFLEKGALLATVNPNREGPPFSVRTPHGTVTVTGTIFWVNATAGDMEVQVLKGSVQVDHPGEKQSHVKKGEVLILEEQKTKQLSDQAREIRWSEVNTLKQMHVRHPDTINFSAQISDQKIESEALAPVPTQISKHTIAPKITTAESSTGLVTDRKEDVSAKTEPILKSLLKEARQLRINRQWSASASTYEKLARLYPDTSEGSTALVTLGDLHRDKLGTPEKALTWYDAYLKSGRRTLIQEALLGKAKALAQLGRSDKEQIILERYLTQYPKALQAGEVKRRLDQLKAK